MNSYAQQLFFFLHFLQDILTYTTEQTNHTGLQDRVSKIGQASDKNSWNAGSFPESNGITIDENGNATYQIPSGNLIVC
jgi:hypothetical protein